MTLLKAYEEGISTPVLTRAYFGQDFIGQLERDTILTTLKRLKAQGKVVGEKQTYQAKNRSRTGKQRTQGRRRVWVWRLNHQKIPRDPR